MKTIFARFKAQQKRNKIDSFYLAKTTLFEYAICAFRLDEAPLSQNTFQANGSTAEILQTNCTISFYAQKFPRKSGNYGNERVASKFEKIRGSVR
jgi:hypothetical protein